MNSNQTPDSDKTQNQGDLRSLLYLTKDVREILGMLFRMHSQKLLWLESRTLHIHYKGCLCEIHCMGDFEFMVTELIETFDVDEIVVHSRQSRCDMDGTTECRIIPVAKGLRWVFADD